MEFVSFPRPQEDVAFTGERFIVNSSMLSSYPEVFAEHVYRYRLAQPYCSGKEVLDAACGAGFGSWMIRQSGAKSVVGVDIDPVTIAYALRDYADEGIAFHEADVLRLPFSDRTFDVVVSFETIEHLPNGTDWLRESSRVLRVDGILIVSTPNREVTNPGRAFGERSANPFHMFEYSLDEYVAELSAFYHIEALCGQSFYDPGGRVAPELQHVREALRGRDPMLPWFPLEQSKWFGPVNLIHMKNAKPSYVVAVCRRK